MVFIGLVALCAAIFSCPVSAADQEAVSLYDSSESATAETPAIPLVLNATGNGFSFDTGGS